ncbi:MAG: hypothetical protein AAF757_23410 [Cyanobacteria bacterium P01_D01_bin.116]
MGESKRRKQLLGDEYGKQALLTIRDEETKAEVNFRCLKYSGEISIYQQGLGFDCDDEYTDSEKEFLGCLYTMLLPAFIDFYGVEKIHLKYR